MNKNIIVFIFLLCFLLNAGVVVKIDGKGTFVSKSQPEKIMSKDEFYKNILIVNQDNFLSYIKPNYDQIKELIIEDNDIIRGIFKFYILWIKQPTNLYFYKITHNWDENINWNKNIKFEEKPFLIYKVENTGWHQIDLTEFLKNSGYGFALKSDSQIRIVNFNATGQFSKEKAYFELEIKEYPKYNLWEFDVKPQEGVYVKVKDGHLYYGDKRLRLWGVCRHDSRRLETVHRIKKMGFNAIRLWAPQNAYDKESIKKGEFTKLKFKDRPVDLDSFDRFFYELKKEGIFVWCESLHYIKLTPELWDALLEDDSFLASGDDWNEWKKAVKELMNKNNFSLFRYFLYFDERVEKLYMKHAENFLLHRNPYTGKKYAEEEAIAIFEIQNENGFLKWILERGFEGWPEYFKNKLQKKWNEYLIKKYKNQNRLIEEWGKLDEGENLENRNIKLSPVFSERYKYPEKRAKDFLEFLHFVISDFNKKFENHCRKLAPEGVGVNVIPFIYDTFFRLSNQWLYVNSLADANSMGIYFWKLTSSLTVPPALYVIDSTTIADKPNLIYEINTSRPNPYRSEDPFRISSFGSFQDWDGIFWHYWNELEPPGENFIPDEQYLVSPLPYMTEYWADGGIVHSSDPVMCSSLSLAGHIFRKFLISPAKKPTIYKIGKDGIFNYEYFRGTSTREKSFTTGAKIKFDLNQKEPLIIEEGKKPEKEEIKYDWKNQRMIIDNEKVKGYIGFWKGGIYKFSDNFAIFNVSSPFISFILASKNGKSIKETNELFITSLFDAKNTNFEMDMSIAREGGGFVGPSEQARAIKNRGTAPVLMDKVSLDIYFPFSIYGEIEFYDMALRKFSVEKINGKNIISIKPPKNFYIIKLVIQKKGKITQQIPQIIEKKETIQKKEISEKKVKEILKDLWFPVEGIKWSNNYAFVHQFLRDSTLNFTSISPFDFSDKPEKKIVLTDFKIFDCICDMEIYFKNEYMERVSFTFKEFPSFEFILEKLKKFIGEPIEYKKKQVAFEETYAKWRIKNLKVELKEFQGFIGLNLNIEDEN